MSTNVSALTLDGVSKLPAHARRCVFWELDPAVAKDTEKFADPTFEKEAWLSTVMLEWGSCGQVASINGYPAGCALYSPPSAVPRAGLFPTSPVSADAVLLTALSLERGLGREGIVDYDGLARQLVQAVVGDLVRRGVRALEAFGVRDDGVSEAPLSPAASALLPEARGERRGKSKRGCSPEKCMIDADFLESAGFEVVAPHRRFPRLRLELDSDHSWKADVEHALDQLMAAATLTVADINERSSVGVSGHARFT
ncbi:GNAT family N-acetyltransferase [Skermania sp. ID1734]|uniref:GNAT family N-acetyltransferase n=1 Tax=Skermania sp. ID1734 TaxID=2597516 RepID=UPI00117EC5AF|nr:GNAT family N-acetyltransferase [Skermania sp. ID1734]TSD99262.1 GNAT family N-acetyltransferase [Skermania sp. ID1734]